ncbi:hypothetical protein KQI52_11245 [bacterium]|nr:hypothetical protein [bacterium]
MLIRHLVLSLILTTMFILSAPCDASELPFNTPPDTTVHKWTGHKPTHVISIHPLQGIGLGIAGSYEQSFGEKHGIYLEGGSWLYHSWVAKVAYQRYSPRYDGEPAIISPYWGAFLRAGRMLREVGSDHFDMVNVNAGLYYGRSFTMGRYIRVAGRFGVGMPLYWNITWTPEEPPVASLAEIFSMVYVSVELGVSVGFMW